MPDLYLYPGNENFNVDLSETSNNFYRCVYRSTDFLLKAGARKTPTCSGSYCFCEVAPWKHPITNIDTVKVSLDDLMPVRAGSSIELYMEFDEPEKVACPTVAEVLDLGDQSAYPMICDRTMVMDAMTWEAAAAAAASTSSGSDAASVYPQTQTPTQTEYDPPEGQSAIIASTAEFPTMNRIAMSKTRRKSFVRDERYFSGSPNAVRETKSYFIINTYTEYIEFDNYQQVSLVFAPPPHTHTHPNPRPLT